MELLSLKIIVLTLSGVVRLFFGMMPMVVMKCLSTKFKDSKLKTVISFLMFFGGGVLMATCFLHMMPEVRESFKTALPDTEFPVAEIIFIGGFFLVYMLEDVIHSVIDRRRSSRAKSKILESKQGKNGGAKSINKLKIPDEITGDKIFQANINGAYQSNGDITDKQLSMTNGHLPLNHNHNNHNQVYHGEMIPTGGVSVLPRLRSSNQNPNDYTMNQINNMMKSECDASAGLYGEEKFSYVDPDWWRDTVIANSQMNLLSTSSFSVAGNGNGNANANVNGDQESVGRQNHNHLQQHVQSHLAESQFHPRHHHLNHNHNLTIRDSSSPEGSQTGSGSGLDLDVASSSSSGHSHSHHGHSHSHFAIAGTVDDGNTVSGSIRGIVIIIAISFHGIFEGLAIGLQSTAKDVWYLFLAVSLHECTILFCIGVELISSKTKPLRMITYILVVSLVSPIGTAIGIVISEESFRDEVRHALVVGSFQGIAAGTLLYVCFFEIFAEEGRNLKTKSLHILVAILGFVLMASLELMGGHNHGGGHSHSHSHSPQPRGLNGSSIGSITGDDDHAGHDHSHSHPGFHHDEEDNHSHEHSH